MMILFVLAFAGCLNVHGDSLTAGDLAAVVPEFSTVPPDTSLGYAPTPGASRNLTGREIQRLAVKAGITTSFQDSVCVEWRMRRLNREEVLASMRASLNQPDANLEIESYSLYPVPEGRIEFPLAGLNHPVSGPAFWRGYISYSGAKRFDIWARVTLTDSADGKSLIDVRTGDVVRVVVENSFAQLKLAARAESSGLVGQKVTVRNPRSGKTFLAEVIGRDNVRVVAGEPAIGVIDK